MTRAHELDRLIGVEMPVFKTGGDVEAVGSGRTMW